MNLYANKNLVKPENDEIEFESRQALRVVPGLVKRLRSIMSEMDWSARELAREAGLKSPTHVSTILKSGDAKVGTLVKIADAGRVRFEWLAIGIGERRIGPDAPVRSEIRQRGSAQ